MEWMKSKPHASARSLLKILFFLNAASLEPHTELSSFLIFYGFEIIFVYQITCTDGNYAGWAGMMGTTHED